MKGEPKGSGHDEWLQCRRCYEIYPKYAAKKESQVELCVEPSTNPFDIGSSILGLGDRVKKTPAQRQRQKLLNRIEKNKDEDIKAELRKGKLITVMQDIADY